MLPKKKLIEYPKNDSIPTSSESSAVQSSILPKFNFLETQPASKKLKRAPKDQDINQVANYDYIKLNEINLLYPLAFTKFINIYGIIMNHSDDQVMTIMDETTNNFIFYSNINESIGHLMPFKTGDVIRVHRLALNPNFIRRNTHVKNIVIFESFGNERFDPHSLARSPTLNEYDKKRVGELMEYINNILLYKPQVKTLAEFDVIQSAFQVLDVADLEKRTIICCWVPGMLIEKYKCYPVGTTINRILDQMNKNPASNDYLTTDLLRQLYNKHMLIYISIFGEHRYTAKYLKTFDKIVVFNFIKKVDRFYCQRWCYLLYDGNSFGQCIRVAHKNSLIAQKLQEEIFKFTSDPPDYFKEAPIFPIVCKNSFRPFSSNIMDEPVQNDTSIFNEDHLDLTSIKTGHNAT